LLARLKADIELHEILERATRKEIAGLRSMRSIVNRMRQKPYWIWRGIIARPAVKDIDHAVFAQAGLDKIYPRMSGFPMSFMLGHVRDAPASEIDLRRIAGSLVGIRQ